MNLKTKHYITGSLVFIITLFVYISAMQPTFAFWDPGEYTAVSYLFAIPHPPGVPFNVLIGRLFSMIPTFSDMGMRIALNSVLASVFAVLMVYLISVKIIMQWKGNPKDYIDEIIIFASSAIGALALAFCGTYVFNALEAESESKAILFITVIIWLMLIWRENHEKANSSRYILLCFFLIGLGVGAHLLVAQAVFIIVFVYYFTKYELGLKSFLIASAIAGIAFYLVFPVVIIKLPQLIGESPEVAIALLVLVIAGIIYGEKKKVHLLKFVLLSVFFVVLGYSIYLSVLLRANVDNLPVNQNAPKTFTSLVSYLAREQYGQEPKIWPRRWSDQPQHRATRENYTSDLEFMFEYQIRDMYLRYLAWQFIGREGYNQDDGIDAKKLFAIPFIIGLIGLYYSFRRDKKTALFLLMIFLSFGVVTALYQNQQNMQPRERDYFYVVSYMIYALWIGFGVLFITDTIREKLKINQLKIIIPSALALFILIINVNMLKDTYKIQNRAGNYLPFDNAYNILQSVEKDAIVITNGDNDTFPLWCLQSAYGIRRDVRVINLSLANADWYNLQLKNETPYGALKVPFTYTDDKLRKLQPERWDENTPVVINVPPNAYPDTMSVKPAFMSFKVSASIRQRQGNQTITALNVADFVVLDILKANNWQRPVYFAATVADYYCMGLNDYLRLEGMANRIMPYKVNQNSLQSINADVTSKCLMADNPEIKKTPSYGFLFRNLNNPGVFYDETHQRSILTYRMQYIKYAQALAEDSTKFGEASKVLNKMEEMIPRNIIKMDFRMMYNTAVAYNRINNKQKAKEFAGDAEVLMKNNMANKKLTTQEYDESVYVLIDIYEIKEDYQSAMSMLNSLMDRYPSDKNLQDRRIKLNLKTQGIKN